MCLFFVHHVCCSPYVGSLLSNSPALVCSDGLSNGYNRILTTIRLTSSTNVFGPVSFNKWQQVRVCLWSLPSLTVGSNLCFPMIRTRASPSSLISCIRIGTFAQLQCRAKLSCRLMSNRRHCSILPLEQVLSEFIVPTVVIQV